MSPATDIGGMRWCRLTAIVLAMLLFVPALAADTNLPYDEVVSAAARRHGVDEMLVHAIITVESGYSERAVSPAGAEGLMQLMPRTQQALGVLDAFDPRENIEAGVAYLRRLVDEFGMVLGVAAYNAGPGTVRSHRGIPPFAERGRTCGLCSASCRSCGLVATPSGLEGPMGARCPLWADYWRYRHQERTRRRKVGGGGGTCGRIVSMHRTFSAANVTSESPSTALKTHSPFSATTEAASMTSGIEVALRVTANRPIDPLYSSDDGRAVSPSLGE